MRGHISIILTWPQQPLNIFKKNRRIKLVIFGNKLKFVVTLNLIAIVF